MIFKLECSAQARYVSGYMPRLAVVIPLYNHGHYIVETLQSVLAQTRLPDRIVIIDDGSKDDSVAKAKSVANPRIEIIEQENAGAHHALNRGIALVSDCEYVAILNSDDRYLPQRFETMLAFLETHSDIQLCCSALQLIDDHGEPLSSEEPRNHWFRAAWSPLGSDLSLCEWLGLANFVGTTSNFVARTHWLQTRPLRDYRYAHDYFALVDAAIHGVLHIVPKPLLEYRVHATNTISTKAENLTREILRVHLDLLAHFSSEISNPSIRQNLADYFRTVWCNVSGFRADVFQSLLALLASTADTGKRDQLLESVYHFPELTEFPNRAAVNLYRAGETLGTCSGFAEKITQIQSELSQLKIRKKQEKEYAELQKLLLQSRWIALGNILGITRSFIKNMNIQDALVPSTQTNQWIRLGTLFGSNRCKKIQQLLAIASKPL